MADISEVLSSVPGWIKGVAATVVPLAGIVAAWEPLGLPVPLTRDAHDAYHAQESAVSFARNAVSFAQKQVDRLEPGTVEYEEAVRALETAQERLDELQGG